MFISIRHKVGLILFVSVFVLTLLIVGVVQYHSYVRFLAYMEKSSETMVRIAIDAADKWMREKVHQVEVLSYQAEKSILASSDIKKELKAFADKNELKNGAYAGFETGELIDSGDWKPPPGFNLKERPWYKMARLERKPVIVPPYKDAMTGKETITFAAPVFDANRWTVKGVVAFDVYYDELKHIIGNIFMSEVDQLIPFRLNDGRSAVLVRTADISRMSAERIIRRFSEGAGLRGAIIEDIEGERFLIIYDRLSTGPHSVVYPVSLRQLTEPILTQTLLYFVATAIGLWLILNLAMVILNRHIKRIEVLSQTTAKIAAGDFDLQVKKTSRDEIGQLADSFNKMVRDLKQYTQKLEVTVKERESLAKELDIAAQIQAKALPREMPDLPGLEIAARSFPAKSVGGDYYDFVYPEKGRVGFVIADAAGKGFPGSFYMSNTRSVFRVVSTQESSPGAMLTKVNNYLVGESSSTDGMFITYLLGVYDAKTKTLAYSNAGHFPPLLYSAKTKHFSPLEAAGLPIGIIEDQVYPEEKVDFKSGDILVMFTDGIIEAFDQKRNMFGLDKLQKTVEDNVGESAAVIVDLIGKEVDVFVGGAPQHDDMTIVVVKAS